MTTSVAQQQSVLGQVFRKAQAQFLFIPAIRLLLRRRPVQFVLVQEPANHFLEWFQSPLVIPPVQLLGPCLSLLEMD